MKYIDYAIKYIIRRLLRMILKPKILFSILIIFIICFFYFKIDSQAFTGDETYTDKNVVMYLYYDNFIIDLVDRLSNCTKNNLYNDLISYLKNPEYGFYVYYGQLNGSTMTGTTWGKGTMNIAIYPKNATSTVSLNEIYLGLSAMSIRTFSCNLVFQITGNQVNNLYGDTNVAFPVDLFNYQSTILTDFLYDNSDSNTQDIVSAIEEQTQATKEQTEKIEEQTEAMTSTDYDDSVVSIDSSSAGNVDNSSTNAIFTNLFSKFSSLLDSENWDNVSTITINLPFVPAGSEGITLRSDMLSSILSGGPLGTLITVSWYSLFGLYVFKFANKIYLAIKSGDILNGLSLNDEVITSTML